MAVKLDFTKVLNTAKNKSKQMKDAPKTLRPNQPNNRYVILPGWRAGEEDIFYHDFGQHFVKDEAGALKAVYMCVDKTYGQSCAICAAVDHAKSVVDKDVEEKLYDAIDQSRAGGNYLLNVLAIDSDQPNTPQVLSVGKTVFKQLLEAMEEWAEMIFDPENPSIINVSKEGSGRQNTKYNVLPSARKYKIDADVIYPQIVNLDEFVEQQNEENFKRALGAVKSLTGLPSPTATPAPREAVAIGAPAREVKEVKGFALDDDLDSMLDEIE